MKHSSKIWLIIAAVLVLIGIAVFVGVMASNNWNPAAGGSTEYETKTFEISEKFENISIRSDTADVLFKPSEDGKCRVEFYDHPKKELSASVQDGTLLIETKETLHWYERITFSFTSSKITVFLPQSEYAALTIADNIGDIVIPSEYAFQSIDITGNTGDVDCRASVSGSVRITSDTGDIRINGVSAGSMELSVHTGKVEVLSAVCEGNLSVKVSTGKTLLTDVSCGSLSSDGNTGSITMENLKASGLIAIKRSTGDVKFERCDAAELEIETDTGDVTGSLLSAKVFIAKSDTGRVDVPETTTGGKCKVTTDTGDIRITVL